MAQRLSGLSGTVPREHQLRRPLQLLGLKPIVHADVCDRADLPEHVDDRLPRGRANHAATVRNHRKVKLGKRRSGSYRMVLSIDAGGKLGVMRQTVHVR